MDIAKIRKKLKEKKAEGQQSLADSQRAEEHEATILKPYEKNSELTATEANLNQEAKAVENERIEVNTTTPVMMDHFGYFSRHFFVWDFWDFSLFCLCFMNQAITSWGFQVILGRTTSRSRRISGTVANTFFFFPLPLHSFQKGKGKH